MLLTLRGLGQIFRREVQFNASAAHCEGGKAICCMCREPGLLHPMTRELATENYLASLGYPPSAVPETQHRKPGLQATLSTASEAALPIICDSTGTDTTMSEAAPDGLDDVNALAAALLRCEACSLAVHRGMAAVDAAVGWDFFSGGGGASSCAFT